MVIHFTEGQQITIASVGGMTNINDTNFTVKNPTTTFELFTAQSAATTVLTAVDGAAFGTYTSGGTASHTFIVLSNVQGEFVLSHKQLLQFKIQEQVQFNLTF